MSSRDRVTLHRQLVLDRPHRFIRPPYWWMTGLTISQRRHRPPKAKSGRRPISQLHQSNISTGSRRYDPEAAPWREREDIFMRCQSRVFHLELLTFFSFSSCSSFVVLGFTPTALPLIQNNYRDAIEIGKTVTAVVCAESSFSSVPRVRTDNQVVYRS